jgi:hypothetical protein
MNWPEVAAVLIFVVCYQISVAFFVKFDTNLMPLEATPALYFLITYNL